MNGRKARAIRKMAGAKHARLTRMKTLAGKGEQHYVPVIGRLGSRRAHERRPLRTSLRKPGRPLPVKMSYPDWLKLPDTGWPHGVRRGHTKPIQGRAHTRGG